jgi:hypothetical protein
VEHERNWSQRQAAAGDLGSAGRQELGQQLTGDAAELDLATGRQARGLGPRFSGAAGRQARGLRLRFPGAVGRVEALQRGRPCRASPTPRLGGGGKRRENGGCGGGEGTRGRLWRRWSAAMDVVVVVAVPSLGERGWDVEVGLGD